MTPDFFVEALKLNCSDAAVEDCLTAFKNPPGRRPSESLKKISDWFIALSPSDQEHVASAMREASDATLFGVLCTLDGVRVIEDEVNKSEFKLTATINGIESQLLPSTTYLHDIFRAKS